MALRIALLRSMVVNRRRISGADARALGEAVGGADVRSVMTSGNIVFRSRESPTALTRELEAACEQRFGKPTEIIVKTGEEWLALVAANPFANEAKAKPGRVLAWVMRTPIPASGIAQLRRRAGPAEKIVRVASGDFFIWFGGADIGDTKLISGFRLNALGAVGTNRTWTTMSKITGVVEEMGR